MKDKNQTIFLTGVTGTLGTELVKELLTKTGHCLYLLVRSRKKVSAEERIRSFLETKGLGSEGSDRVKVFEGDVTLPSLGLDEDAIQMLEKDVDLFVHVAALTALNGTEEQCMEVNFRGTCKTLEIVKNLRRKGKLQKFCYFSTAFVAGSRQDYCAMEDGLPEKPAHANYYESSKYLAEQKVREAMAEGLPVSIFRPSIVVGHSETGEVSDFNVIYPFMKLFAHGILTKLPTHPENSFNIVPINFVIDAFLAIVFQEDSAGKTFHLVTQQPPAIGELLRLKDEIFKEPPQIEVIAPEDFQKKNLESEEQLVFAMLEPYLGYLNDHLTFDTRNASKALEGTGISFPKTDYEFLRVIVGYAVDAGYLMVS